MIRLPSSGVPRPPAGDDREGARSAAAASDAPARGAVRGERGVTVASRTHSLQSRLNSLLAAALAIGVGLTMLGWYYGETLPRAVRTIPHTSTLGTEEGARLPPLGRIVPPRVTPELSPASTAVTARSALAGEPALTALANRQPPLIRWVGAAPASPAPAHPQDRRLRRRLSGPVFAAAQGAAGFTPMSAPGPVRSAGTTGGYPAYPGVSTLPARPHTDALGALLRPEVLHATRAELLPQQRLLLPKGTFIDCTLETAIDSTLPGMTACVTATDTFSADGTVVLLERGTKLIGETRGQVRQGSARVFVIWTEARTPSGVVVRLDSPATDALGRSGLTGKVNRHFWQRFGAALLVSTINGAVQTRLQSSGNIVIEPTTSEDVVTEALRSSVNIPPTVTVPNGARIQVLVARDVDFRSVYELVSR